jgi:riboflavin kinase/FMN adenylyltransferase
LEDITYREQIPIKKTAVSLGLFDGVHIGHRLVIERAAEFKKNGFDTAVFSFRTDTMTSKGHDGRIEMILTDEEKHRHFEKLGVDYLFSPEFLRYKDMTAEDFVKEVLIGRLNCGAAVCGSDFRFGKGAQGNAETLVKLGERYGISVVTVNKLRLDGTEVSSTAIREYIRMGEIEKANRLLGYTYGYILPVEHGFQRGRTWDFPTINQTIPKGLVLPKFGVYCATVTADGKSYQGVTNIGMKPTVKEKIPFPLAETFIIDYDGNLYGREVEIRLEKFVRPERRFASFDELRAEIGRNTEFTKKYFRGKH